jgi:hypothetical protein
MLVLKANYQKITVYLPFAARTCTAVTSNIKIFALLLHASAEGRLSEND